MNVCIVVEVQSNLDLRLDFAERKSCVVTHLLAVAIGPLTDGMVSSPLDVSDALAVSN
jgi:hypothetical protein